MTLRILQQNSSTGVGWFKATTTSKGQPTLCERQFRCSYICQDSNIRTELEFALGITRAWQNEIHHIV